MDQGKQMKETLKQLFIRSLGLLMATAFGGTAIGAVAGDWIMGTLIGVGSAFAVVITTIGVAIAWKGSLERSGCQIAPVSPCSCNHHHRCCYRLEGLTGAI